MGMVSLFWDITDDSLCGWIRPSYGLRLQDHDFRSRLDVYE